MRENRLSHHGKELYQARKQTIERSFADSKNNHGYRYAMYKGIEKNQNYTWLICAAQNMKTIAISKHSKSPKPPKDGPNRSNYIVIIKYDIKIKYFVTIYKNITNPCKKYMSLSTVWW